MFILLIEKIEIDVLNVMFNNIDKVIKLCFVNVEKVLLGFKFDRIDFY